MTEQLREWINQEIFSSNCVVLALMSTEQAHEEDEQEEEGEELSYPIRASVRSVLDDLCSL